MDLATRYPGARTTRFGDSPDLSARLLDLIRSGAKTATCGALRDYDLDGEVMPRAGDLMIALDHTDTPALVYRVTEVQVLPFAEVPEGFALAEGEGDFTDWRADHMAFFARNGGFDPAMPLVCERLEMVEDLSLMPNYPAGVRGRETSSLPQRGV